MTRFRIALALALILSTAILVVQSIIPSICDGLTPDSWLYEVLGCGKDAGGGGGSGAGL